MKNFKKLSVLAAAALMAVAFLAAGCGSDSQTTASSDKNVTVTVGATPVPHAEILNEIKPLLAKEGVDLKVVEFTDYVKPNLALNDKELDANFFQHTPYLDKFNSEHGTKLKAIAKIHVEPMGIYSRKIKDLKDLADGAKVAIPNDPTNLGRALLLLQKEKLITLKEGKGLLPTALDITENPRHLQIMELEGAQLPRVLDDPKVDVAIISTTYIQQTGLSPVHDSVFIEDKNSPYVNILVAREDNKNAENVKEFLQSYQSPEVAKAAETIFNGGAVPGW